MTNDISIVNNKRVGILKVKYDGDTFAIFNYCREGDEKEQCYPTRERAIEMAIELRDKIKKCTTEESDTGITFVEKEQPIFND